MGDRVRRDAFSIAVATGICAVSFGVLSVAAEFSVAQTCVMSAVAFTGASQFMFVSVIGAGGSAAADIPPAVLLAARNGICTLSLGSVLPPWRRALDAHLVIDESTAMAAQRDHGAAPARLRAHRGRDLRLLERRDAGRRALGELLGDPKALGMDAIFPAAVFLALLVPQVRTRSALARRSPARRSLIVLLPSAPAGVPVMASALAALPLLVRRRHAR